MALFGEIDFTGIHTNDELLPAGEYKAIIVASGAKPEDPQTPEGWVISKSGKGAYLPFTFEICEGEYKGRQIRKFFNMQNSNPDAERIGKTELKQLLIAFERWDFERNVGTVKESNELHMIPVIIKITQEENKQTGELQNNIRKIIGVNFGTTATQQPVAAPIGTAPMVKPWQRKQDAKPVEPVTQPKEEPTAQKTAQTQEQPAEAPKA